MKYEYAPDIQAIAEEICNILFPYVQLDNIQCFRSYGSSSKYTIARCHALGKIMQKSLHRPAFYALEFLTEKNVNRHYNEYKKRRENDGKKDWYLL